MTAVRSADSMAVVLAAQWGEAKAGAKAEASARGETETKNYI